MIRKWVKSLRGGYRTIQCGITNKITERRFGALKRNGVIPENLVHNTEKDLKTVENQKQLFT